METTTTPPPRTTAAPLRTIAGSGAEHDRTAWFGDARLGVFFHWGLHAIPARGEWSQHREEVAPEDYARHLSRFAAPRFRPERWARLAAAAGARYVVLPAKSFDGFALFHSRHSDFTVRETPLGRDALLEAVDACREADLHIGLSYALLDWHHPDHPVDQLHPLRDDPRERGRPRDATRYLRQVQGQVRELMSNYGRVDLLRFESGCADVTRDHWNMRELVDVAVGLQPQVMLTDGLGDVEDVDIASSDGELPGRPGAREVGLLLNRHHGYARDDREWIDSETLWRQAVGCVAAGANCLVHVAIDANGSVPLQAAAILRGLGEHVARHGTALYGCGEAGLGVPTWGAWTARGDIRYAHVWQAPGDALHVPFAPDQVAAAWLLDDGSEIRCADHGDGLVAELPRMDLPYVLAFQLR
ncbi:MAG TPA: alpha-L-fucosidase [Planctomycetota bacterium]|nr:alpha-L-fucosidase [Planctomycetota bacterium]